MPYKDKNRKREYMKVYNRFYWLKNRSKRYEYSRQLNLKLFRERRKEWFANKYCIYCGSINDLCLHHLLPKNPALEHTNSHLWLWEESKRIIELLKCVAVCRSCHTGLHNRIRYAR